MAAKTLGALLSKVRLRIGRAGPHLQQGSLGHMSLPPYGISLLQEHTPTHTDRGTCDVCSAMWCTRCGPRTTLQHFVRLPLKYTHGKQKMETKNVYMYQMSTLMTDRRRSLLVFQCRYKIIYWCDEEQRLASCTLRDVRKDSRHFPAISECSFLSNCFKCRLRRLLHRAALSDRHQCLAHWQRFHRLLYFSVVFEFKCLSLSFAIFVVVEQAGLQTKHVLDGYYRKSSTVSVQSMSATSGPSLYREGVKQSWYFCRFHFH